MKALQNIWLFFNGKKTAIGSALMTLSVIIQEVVIDIIEYDAPWEHKVIKVLNWFGLFFGGTGLAHKAQKMIK